ncbi:M48 family metallopeptidase [Inhella sp.]|uniref:M48 family metallopeptidase n=1 Tax=Inhella sp. TaxID=1921806 RepID=UPI0035B11ED5
MKPGLLRRVGEQLGLFDEVTESAPPRLPSDTSHQAVEVAGASGAAGTSAERLRQVWLGDQRMSYRLLRARRRSIGFSVGPEGLQVRAPRWVALAEIEAALVQRSDWILRQWRLQEQRRQQQELLRVRWGEGASLPYLGEPLHVERAEQATQWLPAAGEQPARLRLRLPPEALEAQWRDATQAWLQARAREHFERRLTHFAERLQMATPRLRLSSAKGRWGSASSLGVVSLNWRLMHFSPALIDYVVAHEVAHLREMNHGPRFWALVGELLPGFEGAREQLKRAELPGL